MEAYFSHTVSWLMGIYQSSSLHLPVYESEKQKTLSKICSAV